MTAISRAQARAESLWSPEDMRPRRIVLSEMQKLNIGKIPEVSAEVKAEFAQRQAFAAKAAAASEKQRLEVEKMTHHESHEMYLSNISDLSLEGAKRSLGITQVLIERHEDVGVNVHGRYGNKDISDLNTYLAALKDFISKQKAALPTAPTGTSTVAAPTSSSARGADAAPVSSRPPSAHLFQRRSARTVKSLGRLIPRPLVGVPGMRFAQAELAVKFK